MMASCSDFSWRCGPISEPDAFVAHLTKSRSLVPSLALILPLLEAGRGTVAAEHVIRAVAWAEYLESHARRLHAMAVQPRALAARALGQHIQAGDLANPF